MRIRRGRTANDLLAVLDVGTAKVTCLIAARGNGDAGLPLPVRIVGVGQHQSQGVKAGVVVDLAQAEACIREAIARAEHEAGLQVEQVIVGVACGRLKSLNFTASAQLAEHPLNEADVARVMAAGQSYAERDGRRLVHMNRIGWRLDGVANIREPRGMRGRLIEADLHAVTADEAPLRNLLVAVERADVKVRGFVAAPFAAGLAVASEEERRYGVTVIDMGAGLTTLAYFGEGHLLSVEALAIGGGQLTYDIARALTIPLAQAERIKALYARLSTAPSDAYDLVACSQEGATAGGQPVSKARLRAIIAPRTDEAYRLLRERLDRSRFASHAAARVVLTGGAHQMAGMAEFAANVLCRPVRMGIPQALSGLPPQLATPPYAVSVGLVQALFVPGACVLARGAMSAAGGPAGRYLDQVGDWLRQSF